MDPVKFVVGTRVEAGGAEEGETALCGWDVRIEFVGDVLRGVYVAYGTLLR